MLLQRSVTHHFSPSADIDLALSESESIRDRTSAHRTHFGSGRPFFSALRKKKDLAASSQSRPGDHPTSKKWTPVPVFHHLNPLYFCRSGFNLLYAEIKT